MDRDPVAGSRPGTVSGPMADEEEAPAPSMEQLSSELLSAIMSQVFSTRRPQHICAGLSSALKSVGKGLVLGVTTLIAAPALAGMSSPSGEDGENHPRMAESPTSSSGTVLSRCKGVAVGFGAGLLGALALPLAGAMVGLMQICRGAWNTPQALYELSRGEKEWDSVEREWRPAKQYSLADEEAEVARAKEAREVASRKKQAKKRRLEQERSREMSAPSDDYYQLLDVSVDADDGSIKKAYYKQARACHPDKCGGDPRAAARFQRLSQAYQVLSDPKLRAAYDAGGAAAVGPDSLPDYDPAVFFAALFGTDARFERFVGDLALSQLVGAVATRGGPAETAARALGARRPGETPPSADDLSKAMAEVAVESRRSYAATQHEREVSLARSLADLLDSNSEADLRAEAAALATADFDVSSLTRGGLVQCLASSYRAAADEWLGRRSLLAAPAAFTSKISRAASRAQAYASAARAATRGVVAVKRIAEAVEDNHDNRAATRLVDREELAAMSVAELKRLARDNGVDTAACCEKANIVDALLDGRPDGLEVTQAKAEEDVIPNGVPEEAVRTALPVFLDALVRVSIVDVHRTLEIVAAKVLDDESVDTDARHRRAKLLKHFARALDDCSVRERAKLRAKQPLTAHIPASNPNRGANANTAATHDAGSDSVNVAARFERALNVTVASAMGQDLSDFDGDNDQLDDDHNHHPRHRQT